MNRTTLLCFSLITFMLAGSAPCQEASNSSSRFQALKCPQPSQGSTWTISQRDGGNREVPPYLSSLGQGEGGVGVVTSMPFTISTDSITFTVRGHDGQGGGQGTNYVALVEARKGKLLKKTEAPGNDALQEFTWDVKDLKGTNVRFEVHDGNRGGAFAWLGVGMIDGGPDMKVDFTQGMPQDWTLSEIETTTQLDLVTGGVPFLSNTSVYSVIPEKGDVEIACGFTAKRLYFMGCTVGLGRPMEIHGGVELQYESGKVDIVPLMVGFTLDNQDKLLSPAPSIHLHATGNPFQYYFPLALRNERLQMVRLVANPARDAIPCITAITVETNENSEQLTALPETSLSPAEQKWIAAYSVTPGTLRRRQIEEKIRTAYRMPKLPVTPVQFKKLTIDRAFRSEGVAVADFNSDGELDIATGNQNYLGPRWTMQPLLGEPKVFPLKGYSDSFLCFDGDVNGDGALDVIVVGFPGQTTHWLENPGKSGGMWKKHLAVEATGNESPDYIDVDGDGRPELLFMSGNRCAVARPADDPTKLWNIELIAGPQDPGAGHGLGAGDINGDGITDILSPNGWWQGPGKATQEPWQFHQAPFFGGTQMCVADLDGDGDNDVLGSSAHAYGIAWTEQTADGWVEHMIDDADSQTHAIHLADMNGDGLLDFVTGKRFWAHNGHDPGSYQRAILCWYEAQRVDGKPTWIKHEIDSNSGVGLHFRIMDLNDDGLLDIVTSNKKGVNVFLQTRAE